MAKSPMANVSSTNRVGAVTELLATMEKNLETPVIPGELDSWLTAVRDATAKVQEALHENNTKSHYAQYREMSAQDPGMLPRVDQLKREDTDVAIALEQYLKDVERVQRLFEEDGANEAEMRDSQFDLAKSGIALVVRARTQETAIATWYAEAFDRDCGNKD